MTAPDEQRRLWDTAARGWERRRAFVWETSRAVGEALVAALDPREGETVLELAAGPGDTGFAAAALLGERGRLISTDFAPRMVEAAARRSAELRLANVEHRVVDAQAIDLPDGSVDGVLCRWGYMLMPEPGRALEETRRVLRPEGRVAFSVWAESARNPWATLTGRVLLERGHLEPPDPEAPGAFALARPERIERLLGEAGFGPPRIEEVEVAWRFAGFDDYWSFTTELAAGLAATLAGLEPGELETVRELAAERLEAFRQGEDCVLPGVCLNVLARPEG